MISSCQSWSKLVNEVISLVQWLLTESIRWQPVPVKPFRPGRTMAPLLLTRARCVATRFFGENSYIPVHLGSSFEAVVDTTRLLGTVESFTSCSPHSLLACRAFDTELLVLQDTEKERNIAMYMKLFHIIDSNIGVKVQLQDVRSCSSALGKPYAVQSALANSAVRSIICISML